ncbi:hypothetical protein MSG28_006533 [Choristoneura fumiferana]|uniref:Uncharacterized protein n=1 Tax=Choristoneura fumiferana TaxID=7141 RepID=A0ACC0JFB0_CHOFU|nr:hypothetical protein MSG28_006533 [Choristoneura fumiferana]
MSTWAEQFTLASTWQLKHQLAYWKAKAKSLEYENSVLHNIIRENHYVGNVQNAAPGSPATFKLSDSSDEEVTEEQVDIPAFEANISVEEGTLGEWTETEGSSVQNMAVDPDIEATEDSSDEKNIEVSEEFIQFLMVNAKHKENLRLERERLKALEEQSAMEERENKLKERRHYGFTQQELYGDKWQKISALEMSMKSKFMSDVDRGAWRGQDFGVKGEGGAVKGCEEALDHTGVGTESAVFVYYGPNDLHII